MLLDILPKEDLPDVDLSLSAVDRILEQVLDIAIKLGFKILLAVIAYIIGSWVIKWLRKFIDRFLEKRHVESTVRSFIDSFADVLFKIMLFLIIINILGLSLTSFAAILAAAGLAIGMAMKDNLSNFAGGVMILINKPFKVGDYIAAQGVEGNVQSTGILYTILLTGDNKTVFIPNGPLSTGTITNNSTQADRRVDITLNVNNGPDVDEIKNVVLSIINKEKRIKNNPEPFVGITALNNGTLDVTLRVWVASSDYGNVSVALNEEIYRIFTEKDIYTTSSLSVRMLKD